MTTSLYSLVQLPSALPNGATHTNVRIQDGSTISQPAGYVFQLVKVTPQTTLADGTVIPESQINVSAESYLAAASPSLTAAPQAIHDYVANPPAPVYPLSAFEIAVQAWLDAQAMAKGYSNITTACSYQNDPNPVYAADAKTFVTLRSTTWTNLYVTIPANGSTTNPSSYIASL